MEQARYYANLHELNVFTDTTQNGVGQSKRTANSMSVVLSDISSCYPYYLAPDILGIRQYDPAQQYYKAGPHGSRL